MNVKNKYALSKCCGSICTSIPLTVFQIARKVPQTWICEECKKIAEVDVVPSHMEISKGIFRKVQYKNL